MPHNWCPPSRRGHTWREANATNLEAVREITLDRRAIRVCKRCGKLGCVNGQGVIKEIA